MEEVTAKEQKASWSDCGQIFFCDGKGYGLTDTLQTICLGTEQGIRDFMVGEESSAEFSPAQKQVLTKIREYRKELLNGTANIKRPGSFRSRPAGAVKHRESNLRRPSLAKSPALCSTNH